MEFKNEEELKKRVAMYKSLGLPADIYNNLSDFKSINYSVVNEGKCIKISIICEREKMPSK